MRKLNLEADPAPAKPQAAPVQQAPARAAEPRPRPPERRPAEPRQAQPSRAEPRARAPEPRPRAPEARPRPEPRPAPAPTPRPPEEPQAADAPPPLTPAEVAAMVEKAKTALVEILQFMGVNGDCDGQKPAIDGEETILEVKTREQRLDYRPQGTNVGSVAISGHAASPANGPAVKAPHIVIDIENYRERRRQTLEDMALRLGRKGQAPAQNRHGRRAQRGGPPGHSCGAARRSLVDDRSLGQGVLSPLADHSRGRS